MSRSEIVRNAMKFLPKYKQLRQGIRDSQEYSGAPWPENHQHLSPEEYFRATMRRDEQLILAGEMIEYLNERYGAGTYDADAVRARFEQDYLKALEEHTDKYKNDGPRIYDYGFFEDSFNAISADIDRGLYQLKEPVQSKRSNKTHRLGSGQYDTKRPRIGSSGSGVRQTTPTITQPEFHRRWSPRADHTKPDNSHLHEHWLKNEPGSHGAGANPPAPMGFPDNGHRNAYPIDRRSNFDGDAAATMNDAPQTEFYRIKEKPFTEIPDSTLSMNERYRRALIDLLRHNAD